MDREELENWSTTLLMFALTEALKNDDQDEINKIAEPLAKRMCPDTTSKEYKETLHSLGYIEPETKEVGFIKRFILTRSNIN